MDRVVKIGFDAGKGAGLAEWIEERRKELGLLSGKLSVDKDKNTLTYERPANINVKKYEQEIDFVLKTLRRLGINPEVYAQA